MKGIREMTFNERFKSKAEFFLKNKFMFTGYDILHIESILEDAECDGVTINDMEYVIKIVDKAETDYINSVVKKHKFTFLD